MRYPLLSHQIAHIEHRKDKKFEKLICELLEYIFPDSDINHTGGVNDRGRDVVVHNAGFLNETYVFQVKYRGKQDNGELRPIGVSEVREYCIHSLSAENNCAAVITNTKFTKPAQDCSENHGLKLIDGDRLAELLIRYKTTDLLNKYYDKPNITNIDQMFKTTRKLGGIKVEEKTFDSNELLIDRTVKHSDPVYSMTVDNLYETAVRRLFELKFFDGNDLPIPVDVCDSRNLICEKIDQPNRKPKFASAVVQIMPDIYLNIPRKNKLKGKTLNSLGIICVNKHEERMSAQQIIPKLKRQALQSY